MQYTALLLCQLTQTSCFELTWILVPLGRSAPLYFHGPSIAGADATAMFPEVENRQYTPLS